MASTAVSAKTARRRSLWRTAQFDTLRLRLIKVAIGVVELASRANILLPTACPDKAIFTNLARTVAPQVP